MTTAGIREQPWVPVRRGRMAKPCNEPTGCYQLLLHVPHSRRIRTGALGLLQFDAGWYVYCGSAKRNLPQRLARHIRRAKTRHWHVDYLTTHRGVLVAAVRWWAGNATDECTLVADLLSQPDTSRAIERFGNGDCIRRCTGHLVCVSPCFIDIATMAYDISM